MRCEWLWGCGAAASMVVDIRFGSSANCQRYCLAHTTELCHSIERLARKPDELVVSAL